MIHNSICVIEISELIVEWQSKLFGDYTSSISTEPLKSESAYVSNMQLWNERLWNAYLDEIRTMKKKNIVLGLNITLAQKDDFVCM